MELELVWFDDHKGTCTQSADRYRFTLTAGNPNLVVPAPCKADGTAYADPVFEKSMAFLIQPAGYAPDRQFAPIPNEPIGQIVAIGASKSDNRDIRERPLIAQSTAYAYEARTKPGLDDSSTPGYDERNDYYYYWDFGPHGIIDQGLPTEQIQFYGDWGAYSVPNVTNLGTGWEPPVSVGIFKDEAKTQRVSGDIIHVYVDPNL